MIVCKCHQNPLGQLLKFCQLWGTVTRPLLMGWYTRNPWFSTFFRKSQWVFDVSSWNRRRNLPVCKQYLRTMNRKYKYWKQERHSVYGSLLSRLWNDVNFTRICGIEQFYDQYGHCTVWNIFIVKIFIQITYHLRSDNVDIVLDMYILYPFLYPDQVSGSSCITMTR